MARGLNVPSLHSFQASRERERQGGIMPVSDFLINLERTITDEFAVGMLSTIYTDLDVLEKVQKVVADAIATIKPEAAPLPVAVENHRLREKFRALQMDLSASLEEIDYINADTPPEFALDLLKQIRRKLEPTMEAKI